MAAMIDATAGDRTPDEGTPAAVGGFLWSGLGSFLAAGTVLFASLAVGSSASLLVAGGNDLIAAILEGFLELGLLAFGGFLAAVVVALLLTRRRG